jgi:predicted transcriptional regulator
LDALTYTRSELEKELVLLEKHLKQYPYMKPDFCIDCALKHFTAIEGLSEEGVGFAKSEEEKKFFIRVADWAKKWRSNLPKSDEDAVRAAEEARTMRKDLILSPLLGFLSVKEVKSQPSEKSEDLVLDFLATKGPKTFKELRELKLGDVELNRALMKLYRSGLVSFKRVEGIGTLWSISSSNPGPIEKPINLSNILHAEEKNMAWKETGLIVGGAHIFKGIERGFVEVDARLGKSGESVEKRPSTWLNIGIGLLSIFLPRFVRVPAAADLLLTVGGAHMTTKAWDYVEEYMAKGAAAAAYAPASYAPAYVPAQVSTSSGIASNPAHSSGLA